MSNRIKDFATTATSAASDDYTPQDGATNGTRKRLTRDYLKAELPFACSDETTAITAGTGKLEYRATFAMTLSDAQASVTTAPTGAAIVIDVNINGTTILSTKLSIDATEKTSTTAAAAVVISNTAIAAGDVITVDFDQVGSTIAGAGVKVTLIGTRT